MKAIWYDFIKYQLEKYNDTNNSYYAICLFETKDIKKIRKYNAKLTKYKRLKSGTPESHNKFVPKYRK